VADEPLPTAGQALTDWRTAERALATAIAGRDAAEVAAAAAALAEVAAIKTAAASRTALEAATEAEQTARLTATAARVASEASRGEVTKRLGLEADATSAEGKASDAYEAAEQRARDRAGLPNVAEEPA
jgi:hypothetical protein